MPELLSPDVSSVAHALAHGGRCVASGMPHLLIVEGDPAVAFVLRALLKFGNMTCEVVPWALPALNLGAGKYAAVLMDLDLAEDKSVRAIEELRRRHATPLIVISGRSREADKVRALDAGADDFIVKPFFPGELLARIRALLRRQDLIVAALSGAAIKRPPLNA